MKMVYVNMSSEPSKQNFIHSFDDISEINAFYIFNRNGFVEFWIEVSDNSEEVEDEIFTRYSLWKKKSNANYKIIVFDSTEVYNDCLINCDMAVIKLKE